MLWGKRGVEEGTRGKGGREGKGRKEDTPNSAWEIQGDFQGEVITVPQTTHWDHCI